MCLGHFLGGLLHRSGTKSKLSRHDFEALFRVALRSFLCCQKTEFHCDRCGIRIAKVLRLPLLFRNRKPRARYAVWKYFADKGPQAWADFLSYLMQPACFRRVPVPVLRLRHVVLPERSGHRPFYCTCPGGCCLAWRRHHAGEAVARSHPGLFCFRPAFQGPRQSRTDFFPLPDGATAASFTTVMPHIHIYISQIWRLRFSRLTSMVLITFPCGSTVSRCTSNPHSRATCFSTSLAC